MFYSLSIAAVGDFVKEDEVLAEIETDKVRNRSLMSVTRLASRSSLIITPMMSLSTSSSIQAGSEIEHWSSEV